MQGCRSHCCSVIRAPSPVAVLQNQEDVLRQQYLAMSSKKITLSLPVRFARERFQRLTIYHNVLLYLFQKSFQTSATVLRLLRRTTGTAQDNVDRQQEDSLIQQLVGVLQDKKQEVIEK